MAGPPAQFAIDIAARMSGENQTIAQLDELTQQLTAAGAKSQLFSDAIAQTATAWDAAKVATRDAGSALADGRAEFKALETAAKQASIAAEKAGLSNAQAFSDKAAQQAKATAAAVAEQAAKLEVLRGSAASAAAALDAAKGSHASLSAAAKEAAGAAKAAADANGGAVPAELAARAEAASARLGESAAQLAAVKAEAGAAAAALKAGEREYAGLERSAAKAAQAADRAAQAAAEDATETARLAAASEAARAKVDAFAVNLRGLEDAAESAAQKEAQLAKTHSNLGKLQGRVNDRLGDSASKLSAFRGALGDVGGPLGELGEKVLYPAQAFVDLREKFGSATAAGTVPAVGAAAVAAACVALAVAVVAATVAVAAWAVGLADSARKADLHRQALEALDPSLKSLHSGFGELTNDTGLSSDALSGLAKSLKDAKVSAANMPAALRAAALAEAALGQGGAASFVADLKSGKIAVNEFAAAAQQKFGGIVARQMLGLEAQAGRFKANIAGLFGGLNIDPVLKGLRELVALFDQNTAAGRAIKFLFEAVFQPLIDQAQKAAYVIEAFALGFLIGLTKLYIALKPTIKYLSELFGFEDTSLNDVLSVAIKAGEMFAVVFAAAAAIIGGVLAIAFAALGVVVAAQIAIWYGIIKVVQLVWRAIEAAGNAIGDAVYIAVEAVTAFAAKVSELWATISGMSWGELGTAILDGVIGGLRSLGSSMMSLFTGAVGSVQGYFDGLDFGKIGLQIMQGLAGGITGGVGVVVSAVSSAISSAIAKAKALLGIASPSKVFAEIGGFTGEGFAGGVEEEAPAAQRAMAAMVEPPAIPALEAPQVAAQAAPTAVGAQREMPTLSFGALPELPQLGALKAPSLPELSIGAVPEMPSLPELSIGALPEMPAAEATPLSAQPEPREVAAPTRQQSAPSTPASKPSASVSLSGVSFNFYGVEGAEQAEGRFSELLTRILEGDADSLAGASA